jgi:L-alanine-DL-glutamate epimerase-like enolase superfamily enzyme
MPAPTDASVCMPYGAVKESAFAAASDTAAPGCAMPVVERVNLYRLVVPLTTPYRLAFGPLEAFDTILVEAEDRDGRTGLGEATLLTGYTDETPDGAWAAMRELAAGFPGRSTAQCIAVCAGASAAAPFAATALATAMEMLAASPWLQVPEPARVPLLGLVHGEEAEALAREVDALLAAGFRTLKVKVGFEPHADARRVRRIQDFVAGRCRLRIDANQGYDREQGCAFAAALDPAGIELFEQPCAAGDWDAAQAVARVSAVPMMLDESIYGIGDIERAAKLGAARYIKLKLMKMGGLEALAQAIRRIRELGMEPVLGNGVACEIGCWMEACVARSLITNAGEMNGFLKPVSRLLATPLGFADGAIALAPGYAPRLERTALARCTVDRAAFH